MGLTDWGIVGLTDWGIDGLETGNQSIGQLVNQSMEMRRNNDGTNE